MSWYKIKIRKTDKDYSKYIRTKANWKCEICSRNDIKLECSHWIGRRKEATRFHDMNCHCICFNCHKEEHEGKKTYTNWMLKKYGQKELDKLELLSNSYCKKDDKMQNQINKFLLIELNNLKGVD